MKERHGPFLPDSPRVSGDAFVLDHKLHAEEQIYRTTNHSSKILCYIERVIFLVTNMCHYNFYLSLD